MPRARGGRQETPALLSLPRHTHAATLVASGSASPSLVLWGLPVGTVWLTGAVTGLPGATVTQVINSNQPLSNIGKQCSHPLDSLLGNTTVNGLV